MSAYSDWKCGAITDEEYTAHCNFEARMDKYYEDKMFYEAYCPEEEQEEAPQRFIPSCDKCEHFLLVTTKSGYSYKACEYCKMKCNYKEVKNDV